MRLAVFPGTFNPPTVAHAALIEAAAAHADQVRVILPRRFPHKPYEGATFEQRFAMLRTLQPGIPFSVGASDGGLFTEIASECHQQFGSGTDLWFLCGRDAAERILHWDYGDPGAVDRMLQQFGLLVAARQGEFETPPQFAGRIRRLSIPVPLDDISSTAVRERIQRGEPWQHLVPLGTIPLIEQVYSNRAAGLAK